MPESEPMGERPQEESDTRINDVDKAWEMAKAQDPAATMAVNTRTIAKQEVPDSDLAKQLLSEAEEYDSLGQAKAEKTGAEYDQKKIEIGRAVSELMKDIVAAAGQENNHYIDIKTPDNIDADSYLNAVCERLGISETELHKADQELGYNAKSKIDRIRLRKVTPVFSSNKEGRWVIAIEDKIPHGQS